MWSTSFHYNQIMQLLIWKEYVKYINKSKKESRERWSSLKKTDRQMWVPKAFSSRKGQHHTPPYCNRWGAYQIGMTPQSRVVKQRLIYSTQNDHFTVAVIQFENTNIIVSTNCHFLNGSDSWIQPDFNEPAT